MPRHPRPIIPNVPVHITQRGNNRLPCFFSDVDYLVYLSLADTAARKSGCQIHAYALMTNHVHMLVSAKDKGGPASLMKSLGERYVQYVNRRYARSGTLWEGRYRSCLVQQERYLMVCHRYIELNPVRAGIVREPALYAWSSYRRNAHGQRSDLVTPHALYDDLGEDPVSRERAYRALFDERLTVGTLDKVRRATHGNFALGNKKFTENMAKLLGRPITPRESGRPKKQLIEVNSRKTGV
jgi:putative transposase